LIEWKFYTTKTSELKQRLVCDNLLNIQSLCKWCSGFR